MNVLYARAVQSTINSLLTTFRSPPIKDIKIYRTSVRPSTMVNNAKIGLRLTTKTYLSTEKYTPQYYAADILEKTTRSRLS